MELRYFGYVKDTLALYINKNVFFPFLIKAFFEEIPVDVGNWWQV